MNGTGINVKHAVQTMFRLLRAPLFLFAFFLLWYFFLIAQSFFNDLPLTHDEALYLMIAKSLDQHTGFKDLSSIAGQNVPIVVPIGFPLFLSLYWKFFQSHLMLFKLLLDAVLLSGVWLSFLWMRRIVPRTESYLIALAFSSSSMFVWIANSMMTEVLFIPLLYLGMIFWARESEGNQKELFGWLALVCLVCLARVRVVGIFFLVVYALLLIYRRNWLKLACAVGGFCLLFAWEKTLLVHGAPVNGYVSQDLQGSIPGIFESFRHVIWSFAGSMYANIVAPYFYSLAEMNRVKRIIVLLVFFNACFGAFLLWKNHKPLRPMLVAVLVSWTPLGLWGGDDHPIALFRYMLPFFPLLVVCTVLPFRHIFNRQNLKWISLSLCFVIVLNQAMHTLWQINFTLEKQQRSAFKKLHEFINREKVKPDLILSPEEKCYYTYLKTGIHSSRIAPNEVCRDTVAWAGNTVWMIVDKSYMPDFNFAACGNKTIRYIQPPLYSAGELALYRVVPGP